MKNKKMSASIEAMREMGKNGGLKSFMNGGDVTDSLMKAQKGVETKFQEKQRAKDSVATRNKLTDEYWNQPSVRKDPFKNRVIFKETNVIDPDKKRYVDQGMRKKGYGAKKKK
tara:strand:+ start:24141 stop:24479 length:339 start_codon:yes stop_codon:yes gene_type:complete